MSCETKSAIVGFLKLEEIHNLQLVDRLVAIIWWHGHNGSEEIAFPQIEAENDKAGYAALNSSREKQRLKKDGRITYSKKKDCFRINPASENQLNKQYSALVSMKKLPNSDTVFELIDFESTRGYLKKVIVQINLSYDHGLFDCCAVMIRRLLETLIIEAYEKLGRADELKGNDGHFRMFSGLLSFIKSDKHVNLGRQTVEALDSFKKIADSSAHNRRYNASKKDIDDKIDGIKLAVVELRQLAFD